MSDPRMSASEFAAKWLGSSLKESAGSQSHFNDLCRVLGVETPTEADPHGEWYTFEKGTEKTEGGDGFADVWKRSHFAWEYKGKHKDLKAAYGQLLQYREALENPPLLVVCDMERFEVHTNFTDTQKVVYEFDLTQLRDDPAEPLRVLRAVMGHPDELRPKRTREQVTEEAASQFAKLAGRLQERGHEPHAVAHFLNKILFCFYAEDAGLLPAGIFTQIIRGTRKDPAAFRERLSALFAGMSEKGGWFGAERIQWFNGGLFDGSDLLPMESGDLDILAEAAPLDWSDVEPSILGTLFERGLDPDKRGQLGTHYTDRRSILRVVEPVVMLPLRREFENLRARVGELHKGRTPRPRTREGVPRQRRASWEMEAEKAFFAFLERLRTLRVLDPACGSGNFLYVALQCVKDLEKEALQWGAETLLIPMPFPQIDPSIVYGIEINDYAAELARVTVWIGEIQWMLNNGFAYRDDPVLRPLDNIECRDAVLRYDATGDSIRAEWPNAEFIIGNPPFLGAKLLRRGLGHDYVDDLFAAWQGRIPGMADLVCYWHEKAREMIAERRARRAGLLATNSIRGGKSRAVLDRIKETGDIFLAWSDEEWVVEGADVRVSIVGQDDGSETTKTLDGEPVVAINADLTPIGIDVTKAGSLLENHDVAFICDVKGGPFDVTRATANEMLQSPLNPNGRPNSDVVVPWVNSLDITRRPRDMFIIDFGTDRSHQEAALYEVPFERVKDLVRPKRVGIRDRRAAARWWLHTRSVPGMRAAIAPLDRFIATPSVAKHRVFVWLKHPTLPDHQLIAVARNDDYTFGVLHSRAHELWSLRKGTWLGKGNDPRYTPTTTFETFPFPWPLHARPDALSPAQGAHHSAISAAAHTLNELRENWLNPPDQVREEADIVPELPPRLVPVSEDAAKLLKTRTLTNLYNERPTWLANLHRALDEAVFAAYGWPADISDDEILRHVLALNLERAARQGAPT